MDLELDLLDQRSPTVWAPGTGFLGAGVGGRPEAELRRDGAEGGAQRSFTGSRLLTPCCGEGLETGGGTPPG